MSKVASQKSEASTFLAHTHDDPGGRFARPSTVIGTTAAPQYPDAAPIWSCDPVPKEAPLGIEVDAIEPVGTAIEVAASSGEISSAANEEASND